MQIGDNYDLRYLQRYISYFCSNNAKTMALQTGDNHGWDRSPVAFMRTRVVSQFATITTTFVYKNLNFSCQISEKFRFFRQFHKKDFDFPGKLLKNFDIFSGNFTQKIDFSGKHFRITFFTPKFPFIQTKLAIYSYFRTNYYSISLQSLTLSNILSVHDKM